MMKKNQNKQEKFEKWKIHDQKKTNRHDVFIFFRFLSHSMINCFIFLILKDLFTTLTVTEKFTSFVGNEEK